MDNYFDILGQNVPNEDKKEESQDMVNLTVRADAECAVFCDGDFLFTLEADKLEKAQAPAGQHLLEFKSLAYDDVVVEKEVDFSDVKKNYLVIVRELSAFIEQKNAEALAKKKAKEAAAKRKAEEEAKLKAEAKRKAEEAAKRKAEAEAKRKAEEARARFSVILKRGGGSFQFIEIIKNTFAFSPQKAKNIVKSCPCILKEGMPKADAEALKDLLEKHGAKVELKKMKNL
jgi:ribosomal protein L7/L12